MKLCEAVGLLGEQVGGALGMFVATPVVAVLKVFYTHLRTKYEWLFY